MRTGQKVSLKDEVRDRLLKLLRAKDSPAQAVASAARTLLEMDADDDGGHKAAGSMTAEEIDAEIASIQQKRS